MDEEGLPDDMLRFSVRRRLPKAVLATAGNGIDDSGNEGCGQAGRAGARAETVLEPRFASLPGRFGFASRH